MAFAVRPDDLESGDGASIAEARLKPRLGLPLKAASAWRQFTDGPSLVQL